uniref:FERM domain-containing protein n=1 Tax=Acrobeloides nanus TaxID=290746 RepID=A0A914CI95_9BILA
MEERPTTSQGGSTHALQCLPSTSTETNHRSSPLTTVMSSNSTTPAHKLSSAASPTGSATSNITSSSIAAPSISNHIPPPLDRERMVGTPSSSGAPSPSLTPTSSRSAFSSIKSGFRFSKSTPTPALSRAKILSSLYANVPNKHKLIHVHTLTSENLPIAVESKCQVWDIFHCCCVHLSIEDDRFFGLSIRSPSEGYHVFASIQRS